MKPIPGPYGIIIRNRKITLAFASYNDATDFAEDNNIVAAPYEPQEAIHVSKPFLLDLPETFKGAWW